jgi:pimeloyl-ACP methyl ester carboxylesterase
MNSVFKRRDVTLLVGGLLMGADLRAAMSSESSSRGIDQLSFVFIGGIDQWISIKGEDRRNPVLLVVHGGPGEAQWPMAGRYQPWEKAFTIVQWDQRGAGHTYGRYSSQTPDVTLDRIARDGIELTDYLRRTLRKRKIVVLGHSWGSIVAVRMVQLKPVLFAAYVGTGQVASWKASVQMQFDLLLAKARVDGDLPATEHLAAIGRPDPSNAQQYFDFTKSLGAAMPPADQAWLKLLRASTPTSLGVDPKDFQNLIDGMGFSAEHLLPDQMATDLPMTASEIRTAFFVIQGRPICD